MNNRTAAISKPPLIVSLVGSGVLVALLGLASQMGRYSEKIDAMAQQLQENGKNGKENQRLLIEMAETNALQEKFDEQAERRLTRLEAKNDAS